MFLCYIQVGEDLRDDDRIIEYDPETSSDEDDTVSTVSIATTATLLDVEINPIKRLWSEVDESDFSSENTDTHVTPNSRIGCEQVALPVLRFGFFWSNHFSQGMDNHKRLLFEESNIPNTDSI